MKKKLLLAGAIGTLLTGFAGPVLAANDGWDVAITPYIWLPTVNGDLNFKGTSGGGGSGNEVPGVEIGPNDYLSNIDFAFAISGEAHHGDWGVLSDFFYFNGDVGNSKVRTLTGPGGVVVVPINRDTKVNLEDTLFKLAATYNVFRDSRSYMDVVGGFRYYSIDTELEWRFEAPTAGLNASGKVSQDQDIWNAIIGVNGRVQLGDGNWFMPYYIDYGFGNVDSWEGQIGVGYTFGWGDLIVSEHYMKLTNGDKLIDNLELNGVQFAASFHF